MEIFADETMAPHVVLEIGPVSYLNSLVAQPAEYFQTVANLSSLIAPGEHAGWVVYCVYAIVML